MSLDARSTIMWKDGTVEGSQQATIVLATKPKNMQTLVAQTTVSDKGWTALRFAELEEDGDFGLRTSWYEIDGVQPVVRLLEALIARRRVETDLQKLEALGAADPAGHAPGVQAGGEDRDGETYACDRGLTGQFLRAVAANSHQSCFEALDRIRGFKGIVANVKPEYVRYGAGGDLRALAEGLDNQAKIYLDLCADREKLDVDDRDWMSMAVWVPIRK